MDYIDIEYIKTIKHYAEKILYKHAEEENKKNITFEPINSKKIIYLPGHPFYGLTEKEIKRKKKYIDNSIKSTNAAAETKGGIKMPPQFKDGSFQKYIRRSGLMQYKFMYDGRRISVYGYTEQECWQKRAEIISGKKKIQSGKQKPKKRKKHYLLGEWAELYYKTYKIRSDGKKINPDNQRYIRYIKMHDIGKMPLNRILGIDLQEFLNTYKDRPNTQGKIKKFLNEILQNAEDNDFIKKNPMRAVKIEQHVPESYNVIQPKDQVRILKEVAKDPKYEAMFWYLTCTGMRLGTALKALNDIDLERCVITPSVKDTKTKKHRTTIPFLPELLNPEKIAMLKSLSRKAVQKYFIDLFKRLEIDAVVHSFRKTFASCAYHVGFKDKQIQEWLAHSSLKTTQDIYVELIDAEQSPIIDYFKRLKSKLNL